MKKIICFGDSNTYGYNPATGGRFDENTRWPKVLQKLLGEDYEIFEEGQNGRNISGVSGLKSEVSRAFTDLPVNLNAIPEQE